MPHSNALIVFSGIGNIDRSNVNDPFSALPWEDLDAIYTALVWDMIQNASLLRDIDILFYRSKKEFSDDFVLPFKQKVTPRDLDDSPINTQIQQAIDDAFMMNYQRVVLVLDNNPYLAPKILIRAYDQLGYDDDCVVLGPTFEGNYFLIGMKANHSNVFSCTDIDPLKGHHNMLQQLCKIPAMFFLLNPINSLNSGINLLKFKRTMEKYDKGDSEFPSKTFGIFRMLEKKYRFRKIFS
ncbi:MAG: DUF2064 domain-containing protein [Bacteroidota bacterium]|nr:DUF2064 domain-containing protein [Bacteroidota bacterium]